MIEIAKINNMFSLNHHQALLEKYEMYTDCTEVLEDKPESTLYIATDGKGNVGVMAYSQYMMEVVIDKCIYNTEEICVEQFDTVLEKIKVELKKKFDLYGVNCARVIATSTIDNPSREFFEDRGFTANCEDGKFSSNMTLEVNFENNKYGC